jgi:hypothetical protein
VARRLTPIAVVAVLLLAGCGGSEGGDGGGGGGDNSPKGTVEGFLSAVDGGDWKAACGHLYKSASGDMLILLRPDPTEYDGFGIIKDCPATLEKHADALKAALEGTDPGAIKDQRPAEANVETSKGNWGVVLEKDQWLIQFVPRNG